jgi:hypothetical protein
LPTGRVADTPQVRASLEYSIRICNWLETLGAATGEAFEASSPGVFGFIPWTDRRRQLAGVCVAHSDMEKSLSVYLRLKSVLRRQIPEQHR